MAQMKQKLQSRGWNLKLNEIENLLSENPNATDAEICSILLNRDLKSIGELTVSQEILRNRKLGINAIVQINRIKDVSISKEQSSSASSFANHPILRLALTDGMGHFNALVLRPIDNLSIDTPPGSKILLKSSVPIESKVLLLQNDNCSVIGGVVSEMITRWKVNKQLAGFHRPLANKNGPPLWVPFGVRNESTVAVNRKTIIEKQIPDEGSEFSESRKNVIQSLTKAASLVKQFNQNLQQASNVFRSYCELDAEMKNRQKEKLRQKQNPLQPQSDLSASYRVPDWAKKDVKASRGRHSPDISSQMRNLSVNYNEPVDEWNDFNYNMTDDYGNRSHMSSRRGTYRGDQNIRRFKPRGNRFRRRKTYY